MNAEERRTNTSRTAWDERGGFINDKKGGEPVEFREMCRMETILEHELLDSTTEYTQKVKELISESTY